MDFKIDKDFVLENECNIAVYPGSFDPFHKGHYDVLMKAKEIFEQVIIAVGVNPHKDVRSFDFPIKEIENLGFIVDPYEGLLTDYIKSDLFSKNEPTIIRGLRNSTDLQFEMTQYRFMQDQYPEVKVVSIFCDKEYEHISSSAIKALYLMDKKEEAEKYLPKF